MQEAFCDFVSMYLFAFCRHGFAEEQCEYLNIKIGTPIRSTISNAITQNPMEMQSRCSRLWLLSSVGHLDQGTFPRYQP